MTITSNHQLLAEVITRWSWNKQRTAMVSYLVTTKHFTRKAAAQAIESFIETKAFLAHETGELH
jgi:hypothetical protein